MSGSTGIRLRMRVGTAATLGNIKSGEFVFLTGQASPQLYLNTSTVINSNASALANAVGPQGPTGHTGSGGNIAGDTGTQGFTGFMGGQGYFGGITGHQGTTGFAGREGSKGMQGLQGHTGIEGYNGAQGVQGFIGSQGSQGFLGFPGIQGDTGVQGHTGIEGLRGITGAQGAIGHTGAQGFGITGAGGLVGNTGIQGSTGAQGLGGSTGSAGLSTGGSQGSTGDRGDDGSMGSQGAQGLLGIPGPTGFTGSQGFTGLQGLTGWSGIIGHTGETGAQGHTGASGNEGYTGATGGIGDSGAQGFIGSQGSQGDNGLTGDTGAQGLLGDIGVQGFTGYSNELGFTGMTGDSGDEGIQGDTGDVGPPGSTGAEGYNITIPSVSDRVSISTSNLFLLGHSTSFVYNSNITVDSNGLLQIKSTMSPIVTNTYLQAPVSVTPITYLSLSNVSRSSLYLIKNETTSFSVTASSQAVYAVFSNIFTQMVLHPSGWAYLYSDSNILYGTACNYIYSYNMNTSNLSNLGFSNQINHMGIDPLGFVFVSSDTTITKYSVNTANGSLSSLYSWTVPQGSKMYATLGYVYSYESGTTSNILRFNNYSNSESTEFTSLIYANDSTLSYLSASPNDLIIYSTTGLGNIYAYSLVTSNATLFATTLDPSTNTPCVDPYTNMMYTSLSYDNSIRQVPLDGTSASSFADILVSVPGGADSNAPVAYSRSLGGFGSPKDVRYNEADSNVYVISLHSIFRITPDGILTSIAGKFPGSNDGLGSVASFNTPHAMCLDFSGSNLYIADTGNNSIRKLQLLTNTVTTTVTGFSGPQGIVCDASNIYVSDTGNHVIKRYNIATQSVRILAGSNGVHGFVNGSGDTARLNSPRGLSFSIDAVNLYIADFSNYCIRLYVVSSGSIGTIAGTPGVSGFSSTNLGGPVGVLLDTNNTIYISDSTNNVILSASIPIIQSTCNVIFPVNSGQVISTSPYEISSGLIYTTDQEDGIFSSYNTTTREQTVVYNMTTEYPNGLLNPITGEVRPKLYGQALVKDLQSNYYLGIRSFGIFKNGTFMESTGTLLNNITSMTIDPTSTFIYATTGNQIFKTRVSDGVTSLFVGRDNIGPGFSDGVGSNAMFYIISSIIIDKEGSNLYICDTYNHRVRMANLQTSNVRTILGNGTPSSADGRANGARVLFPSGLCVGLSGFLYLNENAITYERQPAKLRVYNPRTSNLVTLGPGVAYTYAMAINPQETSFYFPNSTGIQTLTFGREIMTVAGGSVGYVDSNGGAARFNFPMGISLYGNSLLVADRGNNLIRAIDQAPTVTTYAGSNSIVRNLDGVTPFYINVYVSKFNNITSLCLDDAGNIYVADDVYIRLVRSTGIVSTIADSFLGAEGMILDPNGKYIYISDTGSHKIKRLALSNYSITDIAGTGESGYEEGVGTVTSTITLPIPPSVPGLQLWLDAADPNGNGSTVSNGSSVTTWVDKSGESRNAIATGTNTYRTSKLNGLPGIQLAGNIIYAPRNYFTSAIPANTFNSGISVFVVFEATAGANGAQFIGLISRLANPGNGLLLLRDNAIFGYGNDSLDMTFLNGLSSIQANTTPTLLNIQLNPRVTPQFKQEIINFDTVFTPTPWFGPELTDAAFNLDSTGSLFAIGTDLGENYFNGIIYEVIVYNGNISTAQRNLVEGYLGQKWGLTLPVSHPYYTETPFSSIYTISPIPAKLNHPAGLCMSANSLFLYFSDSGNNMIRQICFSNATTSVVAGGGGIEWGTTAALSNGYISISSANSTVATDISGSIYVTSNGGITWIKQNTIDYTFNTLSASSNSAIIYGATSNGLFKSINSGQTFTLTSQPVQPVTGINKYLSSCSANGNIVFVSLKNDSLHYSVNGGDTWNVPSGISITTTTSIAISADGSIMYYGDLTNGVYVSSNTGSNWYQTSVPYNESTPGYYVSCSSNGRIALVSVPGGSVYMSSNIGSSWTVVSGLSASGNWGITSVSPNGTGMAVSLQKLAGSDILLYVTYDSVIWGLTLIPNTSSSDGLSALSCSTNSEFFATINNSNYSIYSLFAYPSTSTPSSGLKLLLRAEYYSGEGPWFDESGNEFDATLETGSNLMNLVPRGDGSSTVSIVLDGSTSWTFPNVGVGNAWTLGVWYKNTGPASNFACIVTQKLFTVMSMTLVNTFYGNDQFSFGFYPGLDYISEPIKLVNGEWIHMVGTWNGSIMSTYVNGFLVGVKNLSGYASDGNDEYRIGGSYANGSYLTGEIGEVRIYDYPISSAEIFTQYISSVNTYFPNFNPSTLTLRTSYGYREGVGLRALFYNPKGLIIDVGGSNLYIVDNANYIIRQLNISTRTTSLIAGSNGMVEFVDDIATSARFNSPSQIVLDSTGGIAYITDTGNNRIRQLVLSNAEVTTLVGSNAGSSEGIGSTATFDYPSALGTLNGYLYTGELIYPAIRRVNISTRTSAFIAGSNIAGYLDTPGLMCNILMNTPQTLNLYSNAIYTMLNYQNTSTIIQFPFSNYPPTTFILSNVTSNMSPILIQNATGRQITVAVNGGTVTNSNLNSIFNISDIKTLYNTGGTTYTLM